MGKNPPNGVVLSYWLKEKPGEKDILSIEILEGNTVLRSYTNENPEKEKEQTDIGLPDTGDKPLKPKAGLNRLVLDMRVLRPAFVQIAIVWGNPGGAARRPGDVRRAIEVRRRNADAASAGRPTPGDRRDRRGPPEPVPPAVRRPRPDRGDARRGRPEPGRPLADPGDRRARREAREGNLVQSTRT